MTKILVIGDGLNIETDTERLHQCTIHVIDNAYDIRSTALMWTKTIQDGGTTTYTDAKGLKVEINSTDAYLEFAKGLGDFSRVFKACYEGSDNSIYRFNRFVEHYQSLSNYMLNMTANLLSYALFFNSWSQRIKKLEDEGKELELLFTYAVIFRKLFLFEYLPDALNDDLEPPVEFDQLIALDFPSPKHLKAVFNEVDEETQVFLQQYLSYSKVLSEATKQVLEESS